jgi:hypothetical protein
MKNYNNAAINTEFLTNAYNKTISVDNCKYVNDTTGGTGDCVVKYLLTKIGTKQKVTDEGLCRAVLDKCQNYTYGSSGEYKPYNDVVTNYIQRALVNVRAAQYKIISEYAETCMVDVANCYNQQVTQVNSWSSSASIGNIQSVMRGACRNVALTCAYAVFDKAADKKLCNGEESCINSVSEMFYNSLLCNDGEVYKNGQCVMGGRVVYDTRGLGVLSDDVEYTESVDAGDDFSLIGDADIYDLKKYDTLSLYLEHYHVEQMKGDVQVYWCYETDVGVGYSCFGAGDTMSASDVKTLLKNGGQLYLSLANSESNCKAIDPDLTWNNGCYCEKKYMYAQENICN